jgi:hypothetical protein
MMHAALTIFAMVVAPATVLYVFYWLINGASRIAEARENRRIAQDRMHRQVGRRRW